MRLKRSAFAKVIGVTPQAVAKHVRNGKIAVDNDGLLDVEAACAAIGRKLTDAQRERAARLEKAAGIDALRTLAVGESPDILAYNAARVRREQFRAEREAIDLRILKDELVDKGKAYARIFNAARSERDQILDWAPRIYKIIAAETGADPAKLLHALQREIDKLLHEIDRLLHESAGRPEEHGRLLENIKTPTSRQR